MKNYWNYLAGDDSLAPEEIFLKIRDLYTNLLKHLYNNPKYIPDFRIHFSLHQGDSRKEGYTICTVGRKTNQISQTVIKDLSEIDNFENSYTWYQDDIFVVFNYQDEQISPLMFITRAFWNELYRQLGAFGMKQLRINLMYEPLITSGVSEFFYNYYRLDINLITTLSALTYESSFINATVYVPRYDVETEKRTRKSGMDVVLKDQVPFLVDNLRQMRKLMEMSDKYVALVVNKKGNVCGLTSDPALPGECTVRLWGHLTWTITYHSGKISYYDGRFHLHTDYESDLETFRKIARTAGSLDEQTIDKLEAVIITAVRQRHGTILVIGSPDDIMNEAARLSESKYSIGVYTTNLYEKPEMLKYLTSIDGALFMDYNCDCYCIGAILDGDLVTSGSTARGSRFNSTVNYINRRSQLGQEFIGIVISEDNTVDSVTAGKVVRLNMVR